MYPFATKKLFNFAETAPETWGERSIKVASYTEKADIFSYAIILWRLFGYFDPNFASVALPGVDISQLPPPLPPHLNSEPSISALPLPPPPVDDTGASASFPLPPPPELSLPVQVNHQTEVFEDPYHHLQEPGKMMADWKLRYLILAVSIVHTTRT